MSEKPSSTPVIEGALSSQEMLRQRMFRLTLIAGILLTGVAGLTVAAVLMGVDVRRQQLRADGAERASQEQLWESYRDQAGAMRLLGFEGRRSNGMAALKKGALGWRTLHDGEGDDSPGRRQLRDEAAALLALSDIKAGGSLVALPEKQILVSLDAAQELLATVSPMGRISIRRMQDGEETARPEPSRNFAHPRSISGMAWRPAVEKDPAHSWLAVWFQDGAVAMWRFPEGDICYEFHPQKSVLMGGGPTPGAFSTDGRYMTFYTGDVTPLNIIDLETYAPVPNTLKSGRTALSIRPGTTEIAYARAGAVDLIDFPTGEIRHTWQISTAMHTLAWSHDGDKLAGMAWTGDVTIWSLEAKTAWTLAGHSAPCRALAFSPDDSTLMTSSPDGTTRWWNPGRGTLLLTSTTGKGLSYNKTGTAIRFENNAGGLGEWTVQPSLVQHGIPLPGKQETPTVFFELSPDGKWLIAGTPEAPYIWPTDSTIRARPQPLPLPPANQYAFDPKGALLLEEEGKLVRKRLIPGSGGTVSLSASEVLPAAFPEGMKLRKFSVSEDGHTALVEFPSRLAGITDLEGTRPFLRLGNPLAMSYAKSLGSTTGGGRYLVSPDGTRAVFAYGMKQGATVYDTRTGVERFSTNFNAGSALFSADSRQLFLAADGGVRLVDSNDGTEIATRMLPGQIANNGAFARTADGLLAAIAVTPQAMQLCRAGDLSPVLSLTPPVKRSVRTCRMSHDGSVLAVLASGNEMVIWNLKILRQELKSLGLGWTDAALAPPVLAVKPVPDTAGRWGFAVGLGIAAIIAALAALVMLRRHHGLLRDYAGAEALLDQQRTDLEKANFSLLHSQKMKALGTLAAGMAHDFNNMLSVIRMSNKLIGRETRGHAEVTELVESVETAVLQGKHVVGSLLSYSRGDTETGVPRPVAGIVRDAAALLSAEFLSGITLTLELDEEAPAVSVPAGPIEQILLNLLVNASDAMQGSGRLTLTVRPETGPMAGRCVLPPHPAMNYVEITVADTGPGVPPAIADRIFEPFFSTKPAGNERGTGLGLSMVYTIAERYGIGLSLHSVPGAGAAFTLVLPVPDSQTGVFAAAVRESLTVPGAQSA